MKDRIALCLLLALTSCAPERQAVVTCDGSATDCQNKLNAVQNGDTVSMPAGNFTWTTPITCNKNVEFKGAGQGATIINDNVAKPTVMMTFNTQPYSSATVPQPRIHDFTIVGVANDANNMNQGIVNINGKSHAWRFDHVTFTSPGTGCIISNADVKGGGGVIDHCTFDLWGTGGSPTYRQGVQVHGKSYNGDPNGWGDLDWEDDENYGTNAFVFVEYCTFNGHGIPGGGVVDGTWGGRVVFRDNTVYADQFATHETGSQPARGFHVYEIYNNDFVMNLANNNGIFINALLLRGGTGLVYNNRFKGAPPGNGYRYGINFQNYRAQLSCGNNYSGSVWGQAPNSWDQNSDSSGYRLIDQNGAGKALDHMNRDAQGNPTNSRTGTKAWPNQAVSPTYCWNNSITPLTGDTSKLITVTCTPQTIQDGRDFFSNTALPGYTAFTDPHPLTGGSPPPTTATPTPTGGRTFASDGSSASVQAMHSQAADGDTVTMPAGNFTWTTKVTFTKGVSLVGAGKTATVITDNCPSPGTIMSFTYNAGLPVNPQIGGFTVQGGTTGDGGQNAGIIHISGTNHFIRVHDIKLYHPASGLFTHDNTWGVIDHSDFYCESSAAGGGPVIPVTINHGTWPAPDGSQAWGDGSWRDDTHLGSGEGWVIEDCYFLAGGAGGTGVGDSGNGVNNGGARYTIRHCVMENQNWGVHGTETRTRGIRQFEVYDNEFRYTLPAGNMMAKGATIRGGTGVIYNNWWHATNSGVAGFQDCLVFQTYRDFQSGGKPFGGNPTPTTWDAPDPRLDQCGTGKTLDALDRVNDPAGGPDCPPGYPPCVPVNHRTGGPDWPRNQSEPIYVWNNTWNPVPNNQGSFINTHCCTTLTVYGPDAPSPNTSRDVKDNGNCTDGTHPCTKGTAKPGYTAYQYPHPLVTGGGTPPPATATPNATPTQTPSQSPSATSSPRPTATPSPTPPPSGTPIAPSNLVVVQKSPTIISLAWTNNDPVNDIFVYRSTDGAAFGQLTSLPPNRTGMDDNPVVAGQTYWYKLRTRTPNMVYSDYSNTASNNVTTSSPTVTPTATATSTPTGTPTSTPIPSPTTTPTPIATPIPTATPGSSVIILQPGQSVLITAPTP